MAKRGRPTTSDTCHKIKPQGESDSRIVHCQRRIGHKPPCTNGGWKWTDRAVVARP